MCYDINRGMRSRWGRGQGRVRWPEMEGKCEGIWWLAQEWQEMKEEQGQNEAKHGWDRKHDNNTCSVRSCKQPNPSFSCGCCRCCFYILTLLSRLFTDGTNYYESFFHWLDYWDTRPSLMLLVTTVVFFHEMSKCLLYVTSFLCKSHKISDFVFVEHGAVFQVSVKLC